MGFLLQFGHALGQLLAVLAQGAGVDQGATLFHAGQDRYQGQVNVLVHRLQAAGFRKLRAQCLVQPQGDIRILGGVLRGLFQVDLVEGQLLRALAGNVLEADGLLAKVLEGQAGHVMAGGCGVEDVGLQHGVLGNTLQ